MAIWRDVSRSEAESLERELARELAQGHPLRGRSWRAVARRGDSDDVAFEVTPGGLCVVHLTYREETDSRWPASEFVEHLPDGDP